MHVFQRTRLRRRQVPVEYRSGYEEAYGEVASRGMICATPVGAREKAGIDVREPRSEFQIPSDNRDLHSRAIAITVWFWILHYVVLTINSTLGGTLNHLELAAGRILWVLTGFVICWVVFRILRSLQMRPFWIQVPTLILLGIPAGLLQVLQNRLSMHLLFDWPLNTEIPSIYGSATYWIWFYLAWASAVLAAIYSDRVRTEQRMRAKAQELAHQAQMRTLRYQLNPHFLFNTLNSVAALVLDNQPRNAEQMIRKLAAFLSSGLDSDPLQDVTLKDELDQQLTYLDIERTRFPDRLQVDIRVPDELHGALVPGFILQPLIENAIKHVVTLSADVTTITIEASAAGGRLVLAVRDDGPMRSEDGATRAGVGLRNTAERMASCFGSEHVFKVERLEPNGFQVKLEMPLRMKDA